MAMFALISGLQLVYPSKNGVTTQGLIMVVFFAAAAFAFNRVKEEPEEAGCSFVRRTECGDRKTEVCPGLQTPGFCPTVYRQQQGLPPLWDKLAVCLSPSTAAPFPTWPPVQSLGLQNTTAPPAKISLHG